MQLICPNCGEQIAAENINIQQMVAVCAACDTVFEFAPPTTKAKRRKVKQPAHLMLRDTETLLMTFRTNFRLDKNEAFLMSAIISVVFTLMTAFLISDYLQDGGSIFIPMMVGAVALASYYKLVLTVLNANHIEMNDGQITVSRRPFPSLFDQTQHINLDGVTAIRTEETAISKKENYDTPRYRVWAEFEGRSRQTIVNDVTEEYALFIAQILEERLNDEADMDVSHLADDEPMSESELDSRPIMQQSQDNA